VTKFVPRALFMIIGVLALYCIGLWAQEPRLGVSRTGVRVHDLGALCLYESNNQGGLWGVTKEELHVAVSDSCPGLRR
jgi:hypothetical protein